MFRSKAVAESELATYADEFAACVRGVIEDFLAKYKKRLHEMSARSKASIINDMLRSAFEARFLDRKGITFYRKRGAFLVNFHDNWTIKLKKFKAGLAVSNIETQAVIDFNDQKPPEQDTLPGWPPEPTNLLLGYQPHGVEYANATLHLVCPASRGIHWAWMLDEVGAADTMPIATPALFRPAAGPKPKRVRRRGSKEDAGAPKAGRTTAPEIE
jgi:hypothetical protein